MFLHTSINPGSNDERATAVAAATATATATRTSKETSPISKKKTINFARVARFSLQPV